MLWTTELFRSVRSEVVLFQLLIHLPCMSCENSMQHSFHLTAPCVFCSFLGVKGIQLFRERLSEKVHATIPNDIVGGFEFKESQDRMAREARTYVCECNKSRFDSYKVRNSVLIISHISFRDCRVRIFCDNLSRNSCMKFCRTDVPVLHSMPAKRLPMFLRLKNARK